MPNEYFAKIKLQVGRGAADNHAHRWQWLQNYHFLLTDSYIGVAPSLT